MFEQWTPYILGGLFVTCRNQPGGHRSGISIRPSNPCSGAKGLSNEFRNTESLLTRIQSITLHNVR